MLNFQGHIPQFINKPNKRPHTHSKQVYTYRFPPAINYHGSTSSHSLWRYNQDKIDFVRDHILKIVSGMQEIDHIPLFEGVRKENHDIISNMKDLREETLTVSIFH